MGTNHIDYASWLAVQLSKERAAVARHLQEQHDRLISEVHRLCIQGGALVDLPEQVADGPPQSTQTGDTALKLETATGEVLVEPAQAHETVDASLRLERDQGLGKLSVPERPDFSDVPSERTDPDTAVKTSVEIVLPPNTNNEQPMLTGEHQMDTNHIEEVEQPEVYKKRPTKDFKKIAMKHSNTLFVAPQDPFLKRMVSHTAFELVSGLIILASTLTMALDMQYQGQQQGYENQFIPGSMRPEAWPQAELVFRFSEVLFNVIFAIELVLRIADERCHAFHSIWINLDIVLVCMSVLESMGVSAIDPSMLRVVRLARMVRVLKVVRAIRAFDSVFLLVRSIQSSLSSFFWSFTVMFFIQVAAGMFLNQLLKPYMDDTQAPFEERALVYKYFGTFTATMLTMFEITFANWVPTCRLLVHNVAESYGLFFILYRCMFCFAVLKVIAAVFISETHRLVSSDDELALLQSHRHQQDCARKLKAMFRVLDQSGDGKVSWLEFQHLLNDDVTKSWAAAMEIDTHEIKTLFKFLDTGDGEVSVDEFIDGIPKMRGPAKSSDVMHLVAFSKRIEQTMSSLQNTMNNLCKSDQRLSCATT